VGYRLRLGRVNKSEKHIFTGLSIDEVQNMIGDTFAPYRPPFHTELFEIGKYVDYAKHVRPFYDFDIVEECEAEFHIMRKEGLKLIIDDYHDKVFQNYKDMENSKDIESFISRRTKEWSKEYSLPYYLDEKECDGFIVRSWQFEYSIFNLVYIYRTFNWKNDYLIYSGW